MALDGGDTRLLRPGDVVVNRAGMHQWRNVSGGGTRAGRMLFVIVDVGEVSVEGRVVGAEMGSLGGEFGEGG